MLLTIADYISAGPIVVYFYLLYSFMINPLNNYLDLILDLYILFSALIVHYLKQQNYPKFMYYITRRPRGARNWDLLSRNGTKKWGSPGFPSGHVTTITLFAMFMILAKYEMYKKRGLNLNYYINKEYTYIGTNILIILLTMWARYYKNCHNLFQITGGFILGTIMAYIFVLVFIRKNILDLRKLK